MEVFYYCSICEKRIYKTNKSRHLKTVKHKLKAEIIDYKKNQINNNNQ